MSEQRLQGMTQPYEPFVAKEAEDLLMDQIQVQSGSACEDSWCKQVLAFLAHLSIEFKSITCF